MYKGICHHQKEVFKKKFPKIFSGPLDDVEHKISITTVLNGYICLKKLHYTIPAIVESEEINLDFETLSKQSLHQYTVRNFEEINSKV